MSRRDAVLLAVLTLIWGLNWPIMKLALVDFAPLTFRAVSLIGGLAVMGLIARLQGHSLAISQRWWPEVAALGLYNLVLWFVLSILGIGMLTSGRAAILGYTLPVWVALIGTVVYGERQGPRLLLALAFAATGIGLLLAEEFSNLTGRPLGTLMMVLAAFTWAIGTHRLRRRKVPAPIAVLTFWMMIEALVVCAVIALTFERDRWPATVSFGGWFAMVYNIVLAYGVAQILWFRLATLMPPVISALSVMLIPVVGVFSGAWLLGERPVLADYAALGAMLVAIALTLLPQRRPAGSAAPAGNRSTKGR
ncbi:MAG: DMT family transporter [Burkholderiaceae bacterium]